MKPRRPTAVLVIAIFHFVLGGLGILLGLFGVVGLVMAYSVPANGGAGAGSAAFSPAAQYAFMNAHLPFWKEVNLVWLVIALSLSVLMIVAGVMCLQMNPRGRTLSLIYAVCSILFQITSLVYSVLFLIPTQIAYFDTIPAPGRGAMPPGIGAMMKNFMYVGAVFSLIGLIFPVIVLVFMLLPSIAAAFRGEAAGSDDYGDRYDRGGREDERGRYPRGYEPDDRFGPAPARDRGNNFADDHVRRSRDRKGAVLAKTAPSRSRLRRMWSKRRYRLRGAQSQVNRHS